MKDTPLWKQVAAARRRKRIVLCRSCHQALHAATLKPLKGMGTGKHGEPDDGKLSRPVRWAGEACSH